MADSKINIPGLLSSVYDSKQDSLSNFLNYYLNDTWIPPYSARSFSWLLNDYNSSWVFAVFYNIGSGQCTGFVCSLYDTAMWRVVKNSTGTHINQVTMH